MLSGCASNQAPTAAAGAPVSADSGNVPPSDWGYVGKNPSVSKIYINQKSIVPVQGETAANIMEGFEQPKQSDDGNSYVAQVIAKSFNCSRRNLQKTIKVHVLNNKAYKVLILKTAARTKENLKDAVIEETVFPNAN